MPTIFEIAFWIFLFVASCGFVFMGMMLYGERAVYVSQYELDRLNGAKY